MSFSTSSARAARGGVHREISQSAPPVSAGDGLRWEPILAMTDEFWRPALHEMWELNDPRRLTGRYPCTFRKENVVVKNHRMQLFARQSPTTPSSPPSRTKRGARNPTNNHNTANGNGNMEFTTAFMRTKHRQLYGYFEILAKVMDSEIASNFWLSANYPSEAWTEIDVFFYSHSKPNIAHTNVLCHRHATWKNAPPVTRPEAIDTGKDLSKEPHKFGLDWTDKYISWYIDDVEVRRIPNLYHKSPLHLQFNSETFPKWFGVPDKSGPHVNKLPKAFEIFYVRSWKRVDA